MKPITNTATRVGRSTALVLTAALALTGLASPSARAAACPNEQLREENNSTQLPDCRAYELVSPPEKYGHDVLEVESGTILPGEAAPSGTAVSFGSTGSFAGAPASLNELTYLATRSEFGWSTQSLDVPVENTGNIYPTSNIGSDAELDRSVVASTFALAPGAVAGNLDPAHGNMNLYLRDNVDGALTLIATSGEGDIRFRAEQGRTDDAPLVEAATSNFSHIVLETNAALTAGALVPSEKYSGTQNVYDWTAGELHLVSLLPDGEVDPNGSFVNAHTSTQHSNPHAISADGSRIFFEAGHAGDGSGNGALYMREDDRRTIPISVSQRAGDSSQPQPAEFAGASADGSVVYFISTANLTESSETHGGRELYGYEVAGARLTDLTVDSNPSDSSGANVSTVLQMSSDGSYVYFFASGVLAPGATAESGNIYVWHDGTTKLVRTLSGGPGAQLASPSGRYYAFDTGAQLSAYPNEGHQEVYVYDASTASLTCASCDPSGRAPHGNAELASEGARSTGEATSRGVLDDGSVFFNSPDGLLSRDVNGQRDVYRWRDGTLDLISTGLSSVQSTFLEATPSGDDVFFRTTERITSQDVDGNVDVYDARVNGGFPRPLTPPACSGTGCQGVPSAPPIFATPSSVTFNGVGNFAAPARQSAKSKPKSLTRSQKLAKALHACKQKPKKQRRPCEVQAKRRYGNGSRATKSNRRGK